MLCHFSPRNITDAMPLQEEWVEKYCEAAMKHEPTLNQSIAIKLTYLSCNGNLIQDCSFLSELDSSQECVVESVA